MVTNQHYPPSNQSLACISNGNHLRRAGCALAATEQTPPREPETQETPKVEIGTCFGLFTVERKSRLGGWVWYGTSMVPYQ